MRYLNFNIIIILFTVPGQPTSVKLISISASSVTLQWRPPQPTNGVITRYSVNYGENVITDFGKNMLDTFTDKIEGLKPDTQYTLELIAHTSVGAGPPLSLCFKTSKLIKHLPCTYLCFNLIYKT